MSIFTNINYKKINESSRAICGGATSSLALATTVFFDALSTSPSKESSFIAMSLSATIICRSYYSGNLFFDFLFPPSATLSHSSPFPLATFFFPPTSLQSLISH